VERVRDRSGKGFAFKNVHVRRRKIFLKRRKKGERELT